MISKQKNEEPGMIVFDCPGCKSKLQVADEHAGKVMRCPSCQHTAAIPSADAEAVSAEPIALPPPSLPDVSDRKRADDDKRDDDPDEGERDDDRPRRRRRERDRVDRDVPKKSGMGLGLILALVFVGVGCCFVGPIMIALLVPAAQKVREAAARTQSTNNLKQVALGFHSFHDANKRLPFNGADANPPGGMAVYSKNAVPNTATSGSWGFQILPFIDQQRMFNQVDRNSPIAAYMCPGRGRPTMEAGSGAWTDYFYNNYLNDSINASRPDNPDNKRTMVGITDGTSNTIFVGHGSIPTNQYAFSAGVPFSSNIFLGGTTGTMRSGGNTPLGANPLGVSLQRDFFAQPGVGAWGGPFPQGGLMAMGDATVHMFPYQTANFGAFLTPTGGEVVVLPDR
jgi:uncharacterized Zn finger protein (UPF0148 family)